MLRTTALAVAVVALLAMAPTATVAQPPGVSAPGAEREQAYVDALRREDPPAAERHAAAPAPRWSNSCASEWMGDTDSLIGDGVIERQQHRVPLGHEVDAAIPDVASIHLAVAD